MFVTSCAKGGGGNLSLSQAILTGHRWPHGLSSDVFHAKIFRFCWLLENLLSQLEIVCSHVVCQINVTQGKVDPPLHRQGNHLCHHHCNHESHLGQSFSFFPLDRTRSDISSNIISVISFNIYLFELKNYLRQKLQKGKSVFGKSLYDYGHCPHFPHLPTFPRSNWGENQIWPQKNDVIMITATAKNESNNKKWS